MKAFFRKLAANARPIGQIISLFIVGFLPSLLDITKIVTKKIELTVSQNPSDYILYVAWMIGNEAIGLVLLIVMLFKIRKFNKGYIFNRGDEYKNYPYFWYWICAKILGYSECNLILVPIFMQFKLVIRDTFDKYHCGTFDKKENDIISVNKSNMTKILDEVNLIIADTYPLSEKQIPKSKRKYLTILTTRDNSVDHNRYDSPKLVQAVVNEVRHLPTNIKKVNVFATTNPQNTMNIINNAFKLGERGNLDEVIVFQQNKNGNPRRFKKKGKRVYRR